MGFHLPDASAGGLTAGSGAFPGHWTVLSSYSIGPSTSSINQTTFGYFHCITLYFQQNKSETKRSIYNWDTFSISLKWKRDGFIVATLTVM
jgi:hypothetical protein